MTTPDPHTESAAPAPAPTSGSESPGGAGEPPGPPGGLRHPPGLSTLFFTEMWERFSYYGMRALLVLFMTDAVRGGMGMTDELATAIYGLYTAAVYLACLPGGWVADRLLGAQKSVWYGGLVIACGHFVLAVPADAAFYGGLALVVLGTGLLKPNISAIVGELYPDGGARRDAGFTIFYMGINLGAAAGPLVCSALGEKVDWHFGFAAAGVGMVLGLIQYRLSDRRLGDAGRHAAHRGPLSRAEKAVLLGGSAAAVVAAGLAWSGAVRVDAVTLAQFTTVAIVGIAAVYFALVLTTFGLDRTEKKRVGVIIVLFVGAALFWAGFEQAGSSFNLFAERYTDRAVAGFEIPAGWFQSFGPVFIIVLAPFVASLWVALARRMMDPSIPVKFGLGLVLLALGFVVMSVGSVLVASSGQVGAVWLTTTYLVHTVGELCLSPVGLSSVTKLSPKRLVGQMMGTWFLAASLGSLIAGLVAGGVAAGGEAEMPGRYLQLAIVPTVAGLLLIALAKPLRGWMAGVR